MTAETHTQLAGFIWSICNLLRGPYKRNEYRKVILPLTVLRRFDSLLAPTKGQVLAEHPKIKTKPETVVRSLLEKITGQPFYNLSKLDLPKLLDDPNQLAPNLNAYINGLLTTSRQVATHFTFACAFRRSAQYFFIRCDTAFRAAADIRLVRLRAVATDLRRVLRVPGSASSGKVRSIAIISARNRRSAASAPSLASSRSCSMLNPCRGIHLSC